jgi:hypothetical protein
VKTTIDVEVQDVAADGEIRFRCAYRKSEVVAGKTTKAEIVKQMSVALEAFAGVTGTSVVTSRGVVKDVTFEPKAGAGAEVKAAIETARLTAAQMAQPFPEEEVGAGAKWQPTFTGAGR